MISANAVVGRPWASHATGVLAGLTSGGTFLIGALFYAGVLPPLTPGASGAAIGIGIMVTSVVAAVFAFDPVRQRIATILHTDAENPVHTLALVLAVLLLGWQVTLLAFVDVLAADRSQAPLTILDMFAQELPFLIIAFVGVGLYIRREGSEAAERLGVVRPAWWQVTLALTAAGAFAAFSFGVEALSHAWTPQVAHGIDVTSQHLFGGLDNDPFGIASVALLPAICEEILFRGALQPRLGLIVTALLFTSIHTQYSVSFDTLAVFILAIGLGLIRKYTNTTTSIITHATYNLVAAVSLGALVGIAIAAEFVLLAVTTYALWTHRRRATATANP